MFVFFMGSPVWFSDGALQSGFVAVSLAEHSRADGAGCPRRASGVDCTQVDEVAFSTQITANTARKIYSGLDARQPHRAKQWMRRTGARQARNMGESAIKPGLALT
jgi:hypothetical protein